jgi:hypothetical protein
MPGRSFLAAPGAYLLWGVLPAGRPPTVYAVVGIAHQRAARRMHAALAGASRPG